MYIGGARFNCYTFSTIWFGSMVNGIVLYIRIDTQYIEELRCVNTKKRNDECIVCIDNVTPQFSTNSLLYSIVFDAIKQLLKPIYLSVEQQQPRYQQINQIIKTLVCMHNTWTDDEKEMIFYFREGTARIQGTVRKVIQLKILLEFNEALSTSCCKL